MDTETKEMINKLLNLIAEVVSLIKGNQSESGGDRVVPILDTLDLEKDTDEAISAWNSIDK